MAVTIGQGIKITQGISIAPTVSFPAIITNGLKLFLDAAESASYPGTGTTWYDISGQGNNVALQGTGLTYNSSPGYLTLDSNSYFYAATSTVPTGNDTYTIGVVARQANWAGTGFMSIGPAMSPDVDLLNALGSLNEGPGYFNNYWWGDDIGAASNDGNVDTTNFFYILATFDGTTRTLYSNGVVVGSDTPSGTHNVSTSEVFVGVGDFDNQNFLNADLAAVTVYDRALSPADIATNLAYFQSIYGF